MIRPNTQQWTVLWAICAWTIIALFVAEDYVVRMVFGGWVIGALVYWQIAEVSIPAWKGRLLPWVGMLALGFSIVVALAASNAGDEDATAIWSLIALVVYYWFFGYVTFRVARRLRVERRWRAWVPFLNLTLLTDLANVSQWWAVGLMMPLLGIVVHAWVWCRIASRLAMSSVWGLLMWIPVINAPLLAYIAASRGAIDVPPVLDPRRVQPVARTRQLTLPHLR